MLRLLERRYCQHWCKLVIFGIYKSFKDKLSTIIDEWKSSDRVMYTKGADPKKPPVLIETWFKELKQPGFHRPQQSGKALHGGTWLTRDDESDDGVELDVLDNLHEFTIWDSEAFV
ncbi:hypothetical protein GN958_ATG10754 [Phytophthora infestans]|uniref:Uncharacterized protein n=1 Tax=Phytophthora infestans TaxID=4787 RepID=A0A8S9ULW9_PHYIN|nr:hypothetical protein GN958_ATG10754 [Phytophthora infestans]